jgi:hypothetical protein
MVKRNNKLNFVLKVTENGKVVDMYRSRSIRRFYNKIRTIKWQKPHCSYYLKISCGKLLSNFGKYENFWNDGVYYNEADFMLALNAFTES